MSLYPQRTKKEIEVSGSHDSDSDFRTQKAPSQPQFRFAVEDDDSPSNGERIDTTKYGHLFDRQRQRPGHMAPPPSREPSKRTSKKSSHHSLTVPRPQYQSQSQDNYSADETKTDTSESLYPASRSESTHPPSTRFYTPAQSPSRAGEAYWAQRENETERLKREKMAEAKTRHNQQKLTDPARYADFDADGEPVAYRSGDDAVRYWSKIKDKDKGKRKGEGKGKGKERE